MEKKNLIVGQSGGPTAVINSSLYGVVSEGIKQEEITSRGKAEISYLHPRRLPGLLPL